MSGLHLTSCESVREPGFSRWECLDLARRIEFDRELRWVELDCDYPCWEGVLKRKMLLPREEQILIAALRAYAT